MDSLWTQSNQNLNNHLQDLSFFETVDKKTTYIKKRLT